MKEAGGNGMQRAVEPSLAKYGLQMMGRTELTVEGVHDVLRFEETDVLLDTELGLLEVEGVQLRILRLDPEHKQVALTGTVNGLFYVDTAPRKRGLFRGRA